MPIVLHALGYPLYKKPPVQVNEEELTEEQKAAREAEKAAEAKKKKKVTKKPEVDAGIKLFIREIILNSLNI